MTHELRDLIDTAYAWQQQEIQTVLATVVALEGSSYRRPGVRMLINNRGEMRGAVSGGCVEKEVLRQAQTVFSEGIPKMMTYDGRFRLGCEGILYILLEPISLSEGVYNTLQQVFQQRVAFSSDVYFQKEVTAQHGMGTVLQLPEASFHLNPSFSEAATNRLDLFSQDFSPVFQLYIFGAEHDTVQLSNMASRLGWDVHIIAPPDEGKTLDFFQGAKTLSTPLLDAIDTSKMDANTAVMLMSHSFHKDLRYLLALQDVSLAYIGLLGPKHRRERLFAEFLNLQPEVSHEFFENIHGPAGIHIGAESAPEIAVSIIAEILSVVRNVQPQALREKQGSIHE